MYVLLVLALLRSCLSRYSGFPSSWKTTLSKSQFVQDSILIFNRSRPLAATFSLSLNCMAASDLARQRIRLAGKKNLMKLARTYVTSSIVFKFIAQNNHYTVSLLAMKRYNYESLTGWKSRNTCAHTSSAPLASSLNPSSMEL